MLVRFRKRLSNITGIISLLIFVLVILRLFGLKFLVRFFQFTAPVNIIWFAIIASALALVSFITLRGYKRMPFYLTAFTGFFLIFISLNLREFALLTVFSNDGFNLAAGVALLCAARYVAEKSYFNHRRYLRFLFPLTAAFLITVNIPGMTRMTEEIRYMGEIGALTDLLNPAYEKYSEEIKQVLKIRMEKDLHQEEQDQLVEELNERIAELEAEMRRFEAIKLENDKYRREIEEIKKEMGTAAVCEGSERDENRVFNYADAVRPDVPCVRDFAVKIAAAVPGAYNGADYSSTPGKEGIRQISAIHKYISVSWKYISDPLFQGTDYYSPADRILALGIAGDCDDFSILMASCIQAIGGRSRILHGRCSEGAHAWAEVYVGTESNLAMVKSELRRLYPSESIGFTVSSSNGEYWLSLDWKIGQYSCGENAVVLYQS